MYVLYDNLIDKSTLYISSQAANFPATYIQDPRLVKAWHSLSTTSEWVTADASGAVTADSFSIIAHNITQAATITISGDPAQNWTSPAFSMTVPYDPDIMLAYFSSPQTYRYWRLSIADPTNADGYISIGRLYLCSKLSLPGVPMQAFEHTINDSTLISRSITQQVYADLGVQTDAYLLQLGYVSNATKQAVQTLYRLHGQWNPVIVVPDPNNTDKLPPLYATMMQGLSFAQTSGWGWTDQASSNSSMTFEEAK
jgi:hypothetical protein